MHSAFSCVRRSTLHLQSLPRIDALGSRTFLLKLMPRLCKVNSALRRLDAEEKGKQMRCRALDVGGGVGRTTKDVLLHLVDEVILLEPVHKVYLPLSEL
jgi:protein N-terminal methyltransferase